MLTYVHIKKKVHILCFPLLDLINEGLKKNEKTHSLSIYWDVFTEFLSHRVLWIAKHLLLFAATVVHLSLSSGYNFSRLLRWLYKYVSSWEEEWTTMMIIQDQGQNFWLCGDFLDVYSCTVEAVVLFALQSLFSHSGFQIHCKKKKGVRMQPHKSCRSLLWTLKHKLILL